jgi:predicted nucleic acid-binding Zn finger protein
MIRALATVASNPLCGRAVGRPGLPRRRELRIDERATHPIALYGVNTVLDHHLAALNLLFDKHLAKAAAIVDCRGVTCFAGKDSGRKVYRVKGQDVLYAVLPGQYCSCYSFFFDIVSKSEGVYCKHQLAVFLSDALGRTKVSTVPDQVIAELLETG